MMVIEKRGGKVFAKRPRSLFDVPTGGRAPLLPPCKCSGDEEGNCARSNVRNTLYCNAPVQQPCLTYWDGGLVTNCDTLSNRSTDGGSPHPLMGKRRKKGLLNLPAKDTTDNGKDTERKSKEQGCESCCKKLRLTGRGEYCCGSCGKLKSDSTSRMDSLVGPPMRKASTEADDKKAHGEPCDGNITKKIPGLMDLPSNMHQMNTVHSSPVPLISLSALMPVINSSPTSLFHLMNQHRRPFFPQTISEDKRRHPLFSNGTCSCNAKNDPSSDQCNTRYPRADYVRGADLKLATTTEKSNAGRPSSKRSKSRSKRKQKQTRNNVNEEKDLSKLYKLRADVDQRIAQLKNEAASTSADSKGSKYVTYVRGYYCHLCQRILGDDQNCTTVHSQDPVHLTKLESNKKEDTVVQDSESIFKYYEEKYDCLAFDDTDGKTGDQAEPQSEQPKQDDTTVKGDKSISCQNDKSSDEMDDEEGYSSPDSSSVDDEAEIDEQQEEQRFDRTKMSR